MLTVDASAPERWPVRGHPLRFRFSLAFDGRSWVPLLVLSGTDGACGENDRLALIYAGFVFEAKRYAVRAARKVVEQCGAAFGPCGTTFEPYGATFEPCRATFEACGATFEPCGATFEPCGATFGPCGTTFEPCGG
jgi:hypothetical protein